MAPAYLLPYDKTKTDGDKGGTGGDFIRSLTRASATCKAALMQMLVPAILVLGVESHRRLPPPRAGCCVQVVGWTTGSWLGNDENCCLLGLI